MLAGVRSHVDEPSTGLLRCALGHLARAVEIQGYGLLPGLFTHMQLFEAARAPSVVHQNIDMPQARQSRFGEALGRIIASRTLKAFRKDVTGHLYGGDVSRKNKLLDKQKKGKKKMREHASINIPHDVFIKVMKKG